MRLPEEVLEAIEEMADERGLEGAERVRYLAEAEDWYSCFGQAWEPDEDGLSCIETMELLYGEPLDVDNVVGIDPICAYCMKTSPRPEEEEDVTEAHD